MITIWTTRAGEGQSAYPAYSDTHMSREIWGHAEIHLERLAKGELASVTLTNDGKNIEQSARAAEEESRAADASEAHLREIGA
jgi:hypothetical protein